MAKKTESANNQSGTTIVPLTQMAMKNLGNPKDGRAKNTYLGRIFGQCTAVKTKESRSGDPYQYLVGSFIGIGSDGQQYSTEKLFLPAGLMEGIESQWKAGSEAPVEFAYDIFSNPDDKSATGYRFGAKTLLKTETTDRLSAMSKELETKAIPK
jgi:hypothetical protein